MTDFEISDTPRRMGRKRINEEQMPGRFPKGTFARIDAVLIEGENRSDLVREALEHELRRRERAKPRTADRPSVHQERS